jgi:nucleoid-associated protein YgaU
VKKTALLIVAGAALMAGCASQQPVAKPEPTPAPAAAAPTDNGPKTRYVVKKGDSLWKIAASKKGLNDPFAWPLIFKANRDQIQDPDFIEARQDLSFKKSYSKDEVADAVKKAQATPPFEPRKQPRKVLPIQY